MTSRLGLLLLLAAWPVPALAEASGDGPFLFGVGHIAGARVPSHGTIVDAGLGVAALAGRFEVQLTALSHGAHLLSGERRAFTFVPEGGAYLGRTGRDGQVAIHLYGRARLPIQRRWGADLGGRSGLALGSEVGARALLCSGRDSRLSGACIGLALATRYQVHLSDFQVGDAVLPAGSSLLTFPLTLVLGVGVL